MTTDLSEKAFRKDHLAQVVSTGYKKEGWIVSRQFEKLMEEELERRGRGK